MNFETALGIVLKHEGGYVNHPSDPGGETNFGITARVAKANGYHGSMRDIPMSVVRDIYRKDFWTAVRADELPEALRLPVFDAAVNSGPRRAVEWLQQAVGATPDGSLGSRTMMAARAVDPRDAARRVCTIRLNFLAGLRHFNAFGAGWVRRVLDVMDRIYT